MRRAEIRERLEEARQPHQAEFMTEAGIARRRQEARIELMLGLVIDPILIPLFVPILLLERFQPLVLEEIGKQPKRALLRVFRKSAGWRCRAERQRINSTVGNSNDSPRSLRRRRPCPSASASGNARRRRPRTTSARRTGCRTPGRSPRPRARAPGNERDKYGGR